MGAPRPRTFKLVLHRAQDLDCRSAWDIDDLPLRIVYAAGVRAWQLKPVGGQAWHWLVFSGLEDQLFPTLGAARRAVQAELAFRPLLPVRLGGGGVSCDEHWTIERRRRADGRLGWAIIARSDLAREIFNADGDSACRWAPTAHQAYRAAEHMSCELPW